MIIQLKLLLAGEKEKDILIDNVKSFQYDEQFQLLTIRCKHEYYRFYAATFKSLKIKKEF